MSRVSPIRIGTSVCCVVLPSGGSFVVTNEIRFIIIHIPVYSPLFDLILLVAGRGPFLTALYRVLGCISRLIFQSKFLEYLFIYLS